MTDETPRNDAGQFTNGDLPLGGETLAADLGYVPMDTPQDHPEAESDLRTEAARLAESRVDDPVIDLGYFQTADGEPTPQNKTVSLEKAADDLGAYHAQQDDERARSVSSDFAKEIDKMRADAIKDPKAVEELGLDKEAAEAAKAAAKEAKAEANAEEPIQAKEVETRTETPEADAFDSIEGLEPELKEVLKRSPQARAFLEQNATEAEQVKAAYTTALQQGQQVARATIASLAPQLDGIPLEQWPQAIQMIAQVDPVRGKLVVDALSNWSTIQQAEAQQQQQSAYVQQQQMEAYGKHEDAKFASMIGEMTPAQAFEFGNEMVSYASELGVTKDQLVHQLRSNPVFRSAAFQKMAFDAVQYRKLQKAPRPRGTKELPPVTRPGTSVHRSTGDSSGQIAALQKQIAGLTGDKAARAAAKLMQLQRKA